MGKAVPVQLGNESFPKKGDVEVRIRALIQSYPIMGFVEGKDKILCLELFKYHPNYPEKLGDGIAAIQVGLDEYGKRYFHLHRTDDSDDDISWPKCLTAIK
jgi:hypothetical protein